MNRWPVILLLLVMTLTSSRAQGDDISLSWITNLMAKMSSVNAGNCRSMPDLSLDFPPAATQQFLRSDRAKTASLAVLNRAYFFSYILQKLNHTNGFRSQPNLDYYYLSAATSASSVPGASASGVYYDKNAMYPNFDYSLNFNQTYPLFGARAAINSTADDGTKSIRLSLISSDGNYTAASDQRFNPWYRLFMPDPHGRKRKQTYRALVRDTNGNGEFLSDQPEMFSGPLSTGAVKFTKPYFDCGRTNKWISTAVAPIIDVLPRYTAWAFLRKTRIVAVAAMDLEYASLGSRVQRGNLGFAREVDDQTKKKLRNQFHSINNQNCQSLPSKALTMNANVFTYKHVVFAQQMRTADRLASFISATFETKNILFPEHAFFRGDTVDLKRDHLFGEVLANVMADPLIVSSGVYFERKVFPGPMDVPLEYFAPRAYRVLVNGKEQFKVKDMAGELPSYDYTSEPFFTVAANMTVTPPLGRQRVFGSVRSATLCRPNLEASVSTKGMTFSSVLSKQGNKSPVVQFDCAGLGEWLWTYSVPFFQFNKETNQREFGGVVTVTVRLPRSS